MKTDFQFSNLLGTVYSKGNLVFTPDGNCLLSPVGNRVTIFDLVKRNITRLALTPRGNLLLSIGEDGHAILSHFHRRLALYHFTFREAVTALAFSPEGRHFAVGIGRKIEVWQTPSTPESNADGELEFSPFVIHHSHTQHTDTVRSIQWSTDSRFFLSASKDLTARIWSLNPEEGFEPITLAGHREGVLAAWFAEDQETIYTVSQDCTLLRWAYAPRPPMNDDSVDQEPDEDTSRWRVIDRHIFQQNGARVNCATFHASSGLLVTGLSNGTFGLYELPDLNILHTLSISQNGIDHVSINASGEWLAFGASRLGQLLVWEWQSESYILKQQSHPDDTNATAFSPDGMQLVTGADDGKVKVWDVRSGFCNVTFTEHGGAVTACAFAPRGRVLLTASRDGSVRAWDLVRYRNFRTFTAPTRLAFSCLAVDPSGEIVCAGSHDSFNVHLWSVQTGQLLDQLAGHEGPVASLAFAPNGSALVSGSWDHTVRVWSVFGRAQTSEPLQLQADVLCVAVRPDSRQVAVATLDGELTFWSLADAAQESGIAGRRDVSGGRRLTDRRTAANVASTKAFSSVAYSVDGSCLLAGGNSKYLCLYAVVTGTLVKKFEVSVNLSLDGTQEYLSSKLLTEAGPQGLIDEQGEASDPEDRVDRTLPGATRGDASERRLRPVVRVSAVAFAPTARAFCAASTEGLLLYALDAGPQFDPVDLDLEATPAALADRLAARDFVPALVVAFRLNGAALLRRAALAVPAPDLLLVVQQLPRVYVARLLRVVAGLLDETPHLEFGLRWLEAAVAVHGAWLKDNAASLAGELRAVQRAVNRGASEMGRVAERNAYTVDYLLAQKRMAGMNGLSNGAETNGHLTNGDADHDMLGSSVEGGEGDGEWMGLDSD